MFKVNNEHQGASFNYENDVCKANGEFRRRESVLSSVNIDGTYVKDGTSYSFWASRDANGDINISGVPSSVIIAVSTEVVAIIDEIEALNEDNDISGVPSSVIITVSTEVAAIIVEIEALNEDND